MLNQIISGPEGGVPVLIVHGLYGQGRNLGAIARRLAESRRVILVDQRNHGDSPRSERHDYDSMAGDLAEVIEAHGGKVDLAGHSMGGKAAMVLALTRPELLRKLVVMDIAPVAYQHDQTQYAAAMQAIDLNGIDRRSEADRRLAEQLDDSRLRAFFLQSLDIKTDPARWKLNLPVLAREMSGIVGWPEGLPRGSFGGPALFISGAQSDYVTRQREAEIRAYFPQARLVTLKDAGHWLHADQPEALSETLAVFLGEG